MKAEKFIQCSKCLKELNDFCERFDYSEGSEARELVAEFILFREMSKLKEKQVDKITFTSPKPKENIFNRDTVIRPYDVQC